jgi:S-adenosylmethionine hydrolase
LAALRAGGRFLVIHPQDPAKSREVTKFVTHYAEAQPNELFALFSSTGYLEIAALKVPAARVLEARRGMEVQFIVP